MVVAYHLWHAACAVLTSGDLLLAFVRPHLSPVVASSVLLMMQIGFHLCR